MADKLDVKITCSECDGEWTIPLPGYSPENLPKRRGEKKTVGGPFSTECPKCGHKVEGTMSVDITA